MPDLSILPAHKKCHKNSYETRWRSKKRNGFYIAYTPCMLQLVAKVSPHLFALLFRVCPPLSSIQQPFPRPVECTLLNWLCSKEAGEQKVRSKNAKKQSMPVQAAGSSLKRWQRWRATCRPARTSFGFGIFKPINAGFTFQNPQIS